MNAEMTDGDTQQDNVIDPIVSDVEMASQHGSDIDETASNVSIKSEPEEGPPPKKVKIEDAEAMNTQEIAMAEARLEEIETGFKKERPGRKAGSGAGEVRKQEHEYSVKKKAVNYRKNFATKTNVQKSLVRAGGADRTAKHRAMNKLKNSDQYQAMTDEEKKIAESIALSEFWQSRNADYSKEQLSRRLLAEKALLEDQTGRNKEFLTVHAELAKEKPLDDIFWDENDSADEYDDDPDNVGLVDSVEGEDSSIQGAIRASFLDYFSQDYKAVETVEGQKTYSDVPFAVQAAQVRQRLQGNLNTKDAQMWVIFRRDILRALGDLDSKWKLLKTIGDPFWPEYDMQKIAAAVSGNEITHLSDPCKNYDQYLPYTGKGRMTRKWKQLTQAKLARPQRFFSDQERGLLRSLWAADEKEWVELPGPAEWWPDEPEWYSTNGFEVRVDQCKNYRKGLAAAMKVQASEGWTENLLHEQAPYDMVWNKFFGLFG